MDLVTLHIKRLTILWENENDGAGQLLLVSLAKLTKEKNELFWHLRIQVRDHKALRDKADWLQVRINSVKVSKWAPREEASLP